MKILLTSARKKIATVWFLVSGLLFLILFIQTVTGKYGSHIVDVWGWFSQGVIPGLSLIVGVMVIGRDESKFLMVEKHYYNISYYSSIFYLSVLFLTLFLQPLAITYTGRSGYSYLMLSNIYIAPIQGIVVAAIGIFFAKSTNKI